MNNLTKVGLGFIVAMVGCGGSHLVDFPVDDGSGGSSGNGLTVGLPPPLVTAGVGGAGGSTSTSNGGSTSTSDGGSTSSSDGGSTTSDGGSSNAGGTGGTETTGVGGQGGTSGQGGASSSSSSGAGGNPGCTPDSCPSGQVCLDGVCVDPCSGVECPEAEVCVKGVCVCDGEPTDHECPAGKTELCHVPPGNPAAQHDICVGDAAVSAHLTNHHGDSLGCCH